MKGRRIKFYSSKALLNAWQRTLEQINEIKANGCENLDPYAVAEVTDFIIANIDHYRPSTALRQPGENAPDNAQFATGDNPPESAAIQGAGA